MASLAAIGVNIDPSGATRGLKEVRSQFRKTSDRARRSGTAMQRTMKSLASTINLVKGGLLALGVGFSIRSLTGMITGFAKVDDQVGKTAQKLGIAVEKLSELRTAAELSGVSADTMQMALQRMTRRIAEAAMGAGEAKGALEELGLNAQMLNELAPDQQLREIADAMAQIPSHNDKIRLAFKLFDSEGVAMVNLLENGSAGLDKLAEAARKTGNVLTDEGAKAAAEFNDKMLLLTQTWEGFKRRVIGPILPLLAEWLSKATDEMSALIELTLTDPFAALKRYLFQVIRVTVNWWQILLKVVGLLRHLPGAGWFGDAVDQANAWVDQKVNAAGEALGVDQGGGDNSGGGGEGGGVHGVIPGGSDEQSSNSANGTTVNVVAVVDESGENVKFRNADELDAFTRNKLVPSMEQARKRGMI